MLKLLLSKGADCREKDSEGQTAVHLCTRHKSPKCMALLLKQISLGEIDDLDKNKVGQEILLYTSGQINCTLNYKWICIKTEIVFKVTN